MKTILLPTDFSENSKHAIDYTIRLFGSGYEYILMHAYDNPRVGATMLHAMDEFLEKEARKNLDALIKDLYVRHGSDLNFSTEIAIGNAAEGCKIVAKRRNPDLVAMGTKGATGLREAFIGSNTARTMQVVNCPVLAIPADAEVKLPTRIAVAADLKELNNDRLFDPLFSVIGLSKAELIVVHVEFENVPAGGIKETTDKATWLRHLGNVPHRFVTIEEEDATEGLEQFMHYNTPDMLVVIEHQYPFFSGLFHRSVSRRLAMHTHVPLLALQDTDTKKTSHG